MMIQQINLRNKKERKEVNQIGVEPKYKKMNNIIGRNSKKRNDNPSVYIGDLYPNNYYY